MLSMMMVTQKIMTRVSYWKALHCKSIIILYLLKLLCLPLLISLFSGVILPALMCMIATKRKKQKIGMCQPPRHQKKEEPQIMVWLMTEPLLEILNSSSFLDLNASKENHKTGKCVHLVNVKQ